MFFILGLVRHLVVMMKMIHHGHLVFYIIPQHLIGSMVLIFGEGTMLDSTYGGYDDLAQGFSFNFLYGIDVSKNQNDKISVGLLIGLIEEEQDCPDSYLGYQCYADESPDTEYGFNGGGFLNYSVSESLNLGLRATSNSTQLTIGFKF